MSCAQFLQEARSALLDKFPDSKKREEASQALNSMLNYTRFMMGDELTKISADLAGTYKVISRKEVMFAGKGYNAFVEHLAEGIPDGRILLNRKVFKIIWGGQTTNDGSAPIRRAKVLCENGEEYEADHVVVTCSLGHLKANYQKMFDPPLPEAKTGAINRIGFGRVTKLFVYYDKPFWKEGIKLAWSFDAYDIATKSDWVRRIVGFDEQPCNPKVLGGPFGGKGAEIIETLTDEEVATACRDVLRKFLNDPSVPSPTLVLRSNWNTDPLYLGTYSYPSTESRDTDIEDLIQPLPDDCHPVLLFAGEATHPCFYSTVHVKMSDNSVSVVVVGAGVAGLSTAHHLRQAGFTNITILEASDRVGGRVKSVAPLEGEGAVELGATCIHGASRDNPVYALMEEWGLADSCTVYNRTGGQFCTEEGDRIDRSVAEKVWEIYMDMADDQDEQYKMHAKEGGPEMLVTGRGYSLFVENLVKQIPESKAGAIERMGFGRSNKLFLYYEKPFWKEGVKLAWTTDTPNITTKSDWDIGPECPANNRMKNIKELGEVVKQKKLEELKFLGMLRGYFFHVIEKLDIPADLELRLQLFKVLSEDGKNLLDFEDETGPFLLKLMPDALSAGKIQEFLLVVDAVICYSFLPADALQYVVAALCHMVNKPRFCDSSWELMRKLMGTHLGHKTIYTLCCMMQDKKQPADFVMLRGAVFFTGMALWGSRRIACIKHSPSSVLPSFYQVLSFGSPLIAHEVALNVQRLVTKYGKDLTHLTWDTVFNILQKLLHQGENVPDFDPRVSVMVHAILTDIENLHQRGHFLGPTDRIFAIIEMCSSHRPMESVCRLIDYHARDIHPGKDRQETRTEVRKKALGVLSFILDLNKHVYEAEMIDKLLIPHFTHIDSDSDVEVRKMAVEILMGMAQGCSRDEFFDLIGIVDKITRKPLIVHMARQLSSEDEGPGHNDEKNLDDVRLAVQRLIDAFQHKLYTAPPSHCERLYELIISHMTAQYAKEYNTSSAANIRKVLSNPAQTATGLKLQRTPDNFKQAHLHEALLPVVAALVAYHHVMDKNRQREMVKCLEFGLVTGVAKVCVTSLRICSLEIQDLMMRMLPSVLLSLSIVRLPKLYANFVEEQYMSVYAIAIPYTNPFKFSHYTVSLAHHVISIWYIRCRLPFRKGFAKYIQRGLKNNVTIVFEEKAKEKLSQLNMNSSQRSRSGSEGESYKQKAARTPGSSQEQTLLIDDPMKQFHDELTDANMDLLSRYAFGNMANKYSRYHTRDEEPRQTRDDICLGYEQMHEDAAVQTGSSLSSSFDPETLGPILLKARPRSSCHVGNGNPVTLWHAEEQFFTVCHQQFL
nr:hypothetical protein BaRGS_000187 [Batillaria attramentaria]